MISLPGDPKSGWLLIIRPSKDNSEKHESLGITSAFLQIVPSQRRLQYHFEMQPNRDMRRGARERP